MESDELDERFEWKHAFNEDIQNKKRVIRLRDWDFPSRVANSAAVQYITNVLQTNDTVEVLRLDCVRFSEEFCAHFAHLLQYNNLIEGLWLPGCGIDEKGVQHLAAALQINTTLKVLTLDSNKINDAGVQHLAAALHNNSTLRHLSINENPISRSGWKSLVESLENNTTLEYIHLLDERNKQMFEDAVGLKFLHSKRYGWRYTHSKYFLSEMQQSLV